MVDAERSSPPTQPLQAPTQPFRAQTQPFQAQTDTPVGMDPVRRNAAALFTVELLKAMLQTQLYEPGHPALEGVIPKSYEALEALPEDMVEIGYVTHGPDLPEVLLEGVFDKPILLDEVLRLALAQHFVEKVHAYFRRHRIVSLGIKRAIGPDEYARFVKVFVDSDLAMAGDDQVTPRPFSEELARRKVTSVSVIREEDIIRGRQLPWRVRVAISRARKDLVHTTLHPPERGVDPKDVRRGILTDAVRPLYGSELQRDMLVHSDLARRDIESLRGLDLIPELLAVFAEDIVDPVALSLVRELERYEAMPPARNRDDLKMRSEVTKQVKRSLRHVALRIAERRTFELDGMFRSLFERELLTLDELPSVLRKRVMAERLTQTYLDNPNAYLRELEAAHTEEALRRAMAAAAAMFPELVRRQLPDEQERLLHHIALRAQQPAGAAQVRETMTEISSDATTMKRLEEAVAAGGSREHRAQAMGILATLGSDSAPHLLAVLRDSDQPAVRRELVGFLARWTSVAPLLAGELAKHPRQLAFAGDLIEILGVARQAATLPTVQGYLHHPDPHLREAVLVALARLQGAAAIGTIVHALADPDPVVERRAIFLLTAARCVRPEVLAHVVALLDPESPRASEADEELRYAALAYVDGVGNVRLDEERYLEDVVLDLAIGRKHGRLRRLVRKRSEEAYDALRIQALEVLARHGTEAGLEDLEPLLRDHNPDVCEAAGMALDGIRQRWPEAPEPDPA